MLSENKKYFDACINTAEALYKEQLYDDCAGYIKKLATFAWQNFTGYYTCWKLENLLNRLGQRIPPLSTSVISKKKDHNKLSVLHIASELYEVGGHTKLLFNWINLNKDNEHTLALTRQLESNLHVKVKEEISNSKITVLPLEGKDLEKAFQLKQIAQNYDKVVLHIHPNDTIPIIAFSDEAFKPPVLFLNHADHAFWLGMSVTDCLIQIRESNISIDKERRCADNQVFLPIPINENKNENNKLNIDKESKVILLSTGAEYKYKPYKNFNFFEAAYQIVNTFEKAVFYIAGVSQENEYAQKYKHSRIFYLGNITNLHEYEDACDIYVESFPISSFTAMLQPAMKGKYIQLMFQPFSTMKLFQDKEKYDLSYPESYDEWFCQLSDVIKNLDQREKKANRQYKYISQTYSITNWLTLLSSVYKSSEKLRHKVRICARENKFYFSDNEELLDYGFTINHFEYCENLGLFARLRQIIVYLRFRTNKVGKVGKRRIFRFIFK